jgi:dipeptidyl-peptidase-3
MSRKPLLVSALSLLVLTGVACDRGQEKAPATGDAVAKAESADAKEKAAVDAPVDAAKDAKDGVAEFAFENEAFGDVQMLRYQVPGFESLSLQEKKLAYYLYEAALSGRDIIYDQKFKHNLVVRRTLEAIWKSYKGDRKDPRFAKVQEFTKLVWFARGVHHDYASTKFVPGFDAAYLTELIAASDAKLLPLQKGEDAAALAKKLEPILFDPKVAPKRVELSPEVDPVVASAVNFYDGVSKAEVEAFYKEKAAKDTDEPVWWGLNSRLAKVDGKITEQTWKVGGMYSPAIEKIVHWLEKAIGVAENPVQKEALEKLVAYYKSGDLATWDAYNIAWVKDIESRLDVVNGFIEVYDDPMGYRGSWESVVSFKDLEATKRIAAISGEAQWFEDNSPLIDEHKKKKVVGVSAKVITVIVEGGDAAPTTPIGINLPNSNWIRAKHGSKSVNLGNIVHAYDEASGGSVLEEFAASPEEIARAKKHAALAHTLHVDMHEVIGHASGQINPGIGTPKETLKTYSSSLEEARADLVGLYYVMDQKLVDMGLMPSLDVGKAAYDNYIRNGMMTQLSRLTAGADLEEAHMRNRQLVASWAFAKGEKDKVVERVSREGKTYFVINDYAALRTLFGELLREIQRIKSEGDYEAGKALIETYGVRVDEKLHAEVLERYAKLNQAPYKGFIQPKLVPVRDAAGEITDVKVEYPSDFAAQMLEYSDNYGFLPDYN